VCRGCQRGRRDGDRKNELRTPHHTSTYPFGAGMSHDFENAVRTSRVELGSEKGHDDRA
jgi:hypothetical protein